MNNAWVQEPTSCIYNRVRLFIVGWNSPLCTHGPTWRAHGYLHPAARVATAAGAGRVGARVLTSLVACWLGLAQRVDRVVTRGLAFGWRRSRGIALHRRSRVDLFTWPETGFLGRPFPWK